MADRSPRRPAGQDAHQKCLHPETIDDFMAHLRHRGYAANTVGQYVAIAKRFSRWLRHPRTRRQVIEEGCIERFIRRCQARGQLRQVHHIRSSLRLLVRMLRERGELAQEKSPVTAVDAVIQKFTVYLRDTCGLAESTCIRHVGYVRQFLKQTYGNRPLQLKRLRPKDVTSFLRQHTEHLTPGCVQTLAAALRRFLRHLQLQGVCKEALVWSVPPTRRSKLASIPRTMSDEQLNKLLSSFDRSTAMGRRNYAMVALMSTLGLRASEVAVLQLDDLDWRNSSLRISSPKTRRMKTLPLPHTAGEAIADYLRHGRPSTSHRYVFARHVAPRNVPLQSCAIRQMAIRAYRCCGFDPRWKGTHILRHTVATQLHQRGAALKEVADLLGHRSIETSAIYAKVNLPALAAVALPWPEVTK